MSPHHRLKQGGQFHGVCRARYSWIATLALIALPLTARQIPEPHKSERAKTSGDGKETQGEKRKEQKLAPPQIPSEILKVSPKAWHGVANDMKWAMDRLGKEVAEYGTVTLSSMIVTEPQKTEDKTMTILKKVKDEVLADPKANPPVKAQPAQYEIQDVRVTSGNFGFDLNKSAEDYFNLSNVSEGSFQNALRISNQLIASGQVQMTPDEAATHQQKLNLYNRNLKLWEDRQSLLQGVDQRNILQNERRRSLDEERARQAMLDADTKKDLAILAADRAAMLDQQKQKELETATANFDKATKELAAGKAEVAAVVQPLEVRSSIAHTQLNETQVAFTAAQQKFTTADIKAQIDPTTANLDARKAAADELEGKRKQLEAAKKVTEDADKALTAAKGSVPALEAALTQADAGKKAAEQAALKSAQDKQKAAGDVTATQGAFNTAKQAYDTLLTNPLTVANQLATVNTPDFVTGGTGATQSFPTGVVSPTGAGTSPLVPSVLDSLKDAKTAQEALPAVLNTDKQQLLENLGKNALKSPLVPPGADPTVGVPSNFPTRARLIEANANKTIQEIFNYLGNPAQASVFNDKKILMGVATVSVNPGWKTKEKHTAHLDAMAEYMWQEAHEETIRRMVRAKIYTLEEQRKIARTYPTALEAADRAYFDKLDLEDAQKLAKERAEGKISQQKAVFEKAVERSTKAMVGSASRFVAAAVGQTCDTSLRSLPSTGLPKVVVPQVAAPPPDLMVSPTETGASKLVEGNLSNDTLKQIDESIDAAVKKQADKGKFIILPAKASASPKTPTPSKPEQREAAKQDDNMPEDPVGLLDDSERRPGDGKPLRKEEARRLGLPTDAHPQAAAVSPLMESQMLDLTSSYARQDDITIFLSATLARAGMKGQAEVFDRYMKLRRQDAATRSAIPVSNSYSAGGGVFGFQIGPRLKALKDPAYRGTKPDKTLERQSFPVLVIFGLGEEDIKPRIVYDKAKNTLRIYERILRVRYVGRWTEVDHPWYWWAKPTAWFWPRRFTSDDLIVFKKLAGAWNAAQKDLREIIAAENHYIDSAQGDPKWEELRAVWLDSRASRERLLDTFKPQYEALSRAYFGADSRQIIPANLMIPDRFLEPVPALPTLASVSPAELLTKPTDDPTRNESTGQVMIEGTELNKFDLAKITSMDANVRVDPAQTKLLGSQAVLLQITCTGDSGGLNFLLPLKPNTTRFSATAEGAQFATAPGPKWRREKTPPVLPTVTGVNPLELLTRTKTPPVPATPGATATPAVSTGMVIIEGTGLDKVDLQNIRPMDANAITIDHTQTKLLGTQGILLNLTFTGEKGALNFLLPISLSSARSGTTAEQTLMATSSAGNDATWRREKLLQEVPPPPPASFAIRVLDAAGGPVTPLTVRVTTEVLGLPAARLQAKGTILLQGDALRYVDIAKATVIGPGVDKSQCSFKLLEPATNLCSVSLALNAKSGNFVVRLPLRAGTRAEGLPVGQEAIFTEEINFVLAAP